MLNCSPEFLDVTEKARMLDPYGSLPCDKLLIGWGYGEEPREMLLLFGCCVLLSIGWEAAIEAARSFVMARKEEELLAMSLRSTKGLRTSTTSLISGRALAFRPTQACTNCATF